MNPTQHWFKRNAIAEQKEREGKFEDAIRIYEYNVEEKASTLFSYERLAILYKRQEDEYNEKRIIRKALSMLRMREEQGWLDEKGQGTLKAMRRRLKEIAPRSSVRQ